MSATPLDIPATLAVQSWAGVVRHPVRIIGTHGDRQYIIRAEADMLIPRRRLKSGDVARVPVTAVVVDQARLTAEETARTNRRLLDNIRAMRSTDGLTDSEAAEFGVPFHS